MRRLEGGTERDRVLRYLVNGLAATGVHFGTLVFNLHVLQVPSAGLANMLAAVAGITTSFFGSRYFVFAAGDKPVMKQAARFVSLYASIAILHGVVLFGWTDLLRFDYRLGFLIATALQVAMSYCGNKTLVFR